MTDGRHISQEDLALYAMQALSTEESAAVRLHLAECALCRAELAEFSGDLALVALSVEQHPVLMGARERFMQRISASGMEPSQPGAVVPIHSPIQSTDERPQRKRAVWVPWMAAAALLVLAISLGVEVQRLKVRLDHESSLAARLAESSARAQEVAEVMTAPTAQRVVLTAAMVPAQPAGRAVYLADRGALIFQANNLSRLPENKTYELWLIPANGSAPMPAGLFRPDAADNASVVLPPLPKGVQAKTFAVTIEKLSGSDTPTAPLVLSEAAPAAGE